MDGLELLDHIGEISKYSLECHCALETGNWKQTLLARRAMAARIELHRPYVHPRIVSSDELTITGTGLMVNNGRAPLLRYQTSSGNKTRHTHHNIE